MTLTKAHKAVLQVLRLTRGRDKICRLFQYITRFIAAMIKRPIYDKHFSSPPKRQLYFDNFRAVGACCALTRRIFRFTRYQDIIKRIKANFDILSEKPKQTRPAFYYQSKILSDVCLFVYYFMDNILFLYEIELIPKTNVPFYQWWDWGADFSWVIETIFDLITNLTDVTFAVVEKQKAKFNRLTFDLFVLIMDLIVMLLDCHWIYKLKSSEPYILRLRICEFCLRIVFNVLLLRFWELWGLFVLRMGNP